MSSSSSSSSEPTEHVSSDAVISKSKTETEHVTSMTMTTDEIAFAESATPLQGRKKGFPVMPSPTNMLGMFSRPKPSAREKMRPRNGPPIDEWEAVLVGKRMVQEDGEDDVDTFKKSDLPENTRFFPGMDIPRGVIGRLNVWLDTDKIVTKVSYG